MVNIAAASVDHWLLVRVDRVLQGDLDPAIDLYSKPSAKDKDREKALASVKVSVLFLFSFLFSSLFSLLFLVSSLCAHPHFIQDACPRLAQFRQAMCWGIVPLFQEVAI